MSAEPPEPERTLRCASFHSVKGGVGKSTLSYLVARLLAERAKPGERVALVDADLTGTSLADVLTLRAPRWHGLGADDALPLGRVPDEWRPLDAARSSLAVRAAREDGHARVVPLLNDFLLWQEHRHEPDGDVHPEALFWKPLEDDPLAERLVVLPSSALPNDLAHVVPLIHDELHAAYLESRLEWLLHWLLEKADVRTVVFDTPPTIPGLSRAVLSMAMRLPDDTPLADDGGTPKWLTRAEGTAIQWAAFLVVSTDLQDLHAAERWLQGRQTHEIDRIHVVINRAWRKDPEETLKARLAGVSSSGAGESAAAGMVTLYGGDLLRSPLVVQEDQSELRIFTGEPRSPRALADLVTLVEHVGKTRPG